MMMRLYGIEMRLESSTIYETERNKGDKKNEYGNGIFEDWENLYLKIFTMFYSIYGGMKVSRWWLNPFKFW